MSFEDEFNKESQAAIDATREVTRVVAIEFFSSIILGTPVGNPQLWKNPPPPGYTGGSARANWFLTFVNPSTRTTQDKDTGRRTADQVAAQIAQRISSEYILTNNLPYIERLEKGWSTQSPGGFVALNARRVESLIPRIEREANRKFGVS